MSSESFKRRRSRMREHADTQIWALWRDLKELVQSNESRAYIEQELGVALQKAFNIGLTLQGEINALTSQRTILKLCDPNYQYWSGKRLKGEERVLP